jgi:hypothetical protein
MNQVPPFDPLGLALAAAENAPWAPPEEPTVAAHLRTRLDAERALVFGLLFEKVGMWRQVPDLDVLLGEFTGPLAMIVEAVREAWRQGNPIAYTHVLRFLRERGNDRACEEATAIAYEFADLGVATQAIQKLRALRERRMSGRYGDHTLLTANEFPAEPIEWIWEGFIPRGEISILQGLPGCSKSTLSVDVAARLGTGRAMPGSSRTLPAEPSIILAYEGEKTIAPRLAAAGGLVPAVKCVKQGPAELRLPSDFDHLEAMVTDHRAALLVIDTFNRSLDDGCSISSPNVKRALEPLQLLAHRTGVAPLLLSHVTKSARLNDIHGGAGSIVISGIARSILEISKDPSDPRRRVLTCPKWFGAEHSPLTFKIFEDGGAPKID